MFFFLFARNIQDSWMFKNVSQKNVDFFVFLVLIFKIFSLKNRTGKKFWKTFFSSAESHQTRKIRPIIFYQLEFYVELTRGQIKFVFH